VSAQYPEIEYGSLLSSGTGGSGTELWSMLPAELATLLRPRIPRLTRDILVEIQREVPAFAQPADEAFGRSIVEHVQQAVLQFIERLADPSRPQEDHRRRFRDLGEFELDDGQIVDALQQAYQIGARVSWRHLAAIGQRAGVPTEKMCLLAEAIFAYIDELSSLSVEGHAASRARAAGAVERKRRHLLEMILSGPSATPSANALARLAEAARWPVPAEVVAVALGDRGEFVLMTSELDRRMLVDLEGNEPCLLVSSAERELVADLPSVLPGWQAAVGPAVPVAQAHRSLHWARRTAHLVQTGVLPAAEVTWFDDHLATLWLSHDVFLVNEIAAAAMAPLAAIPPRQREKLAETLLLWLETSYTAPELAQELDVHPQTVRYRLNQLRGLFGDRLHQTDTRLGLLVALHAARMNQAESA
jgi:hypothetical protein